MSSTYGDLKPQIQRNIGNRLDSDSGSSILFFFNSAQRLAATLHNWWELEKKVCPVLAKDIADYNIELERFNKFYSTVLITSTKGYPLDFISPLKWDQEIIPYIPTATSGRPTIYTKWGNVISLFRKPDDAYSLVIRFHQWPLPVTDDTTVIQFKELDEVLILLTTGLFFFSIEEIEVGTRWFGLASKLLTSYNISKELLPNLTALQGFIKGDISKNLSGDYWLNPFIHSKPK